LFSIEKEDLEDVHGHLLGAVTDEDGLYVRGEHWYQALVDFCGYVFVDFGIGGFEDAFQKF